MPKDGRNFVAFGRILVNYRPQKYYSVGGNLINFPGGVSTPTADLDTSKLLFNSVVSTPGRKYMCCDIKNFNLGTLMDRY